MKKFYVFKDERQIGPFSKEDLVSIPVTSETLVWFEGAYDWTKAEDIAELQDVLKKVPPPIKSTGAATPPPVVKATVQESKKRVDSPKRSKTSIFLIITVLLLVAGVAAFLFVENEGQKARVANEMMDLRMKLSEQERIENARKEEEARQIRSQLKKEYDLTLTNLRAAKIKLDDLQKFKLLRSASEKEAQVEEQLEIIRELENELERLERTLEQE
jgi:hypothetical protein